MHSSCIDIHTITHIHIHIYIYIYVERERGREREREKEKERERGRERQRDSDKQPYPSLLESEHLNEDRVAAVEIPGRHERSRQLTVMARVLAARWDLRMAWGLGFRV